MDDGEEIVIVSPGDLVQLNVDSPLYIGKLLCRVISVFLNSIPINMQ